LIALLIILVFVAFALMMVLRWMPAIIAVPLMATIMALAAGVPFTHLGHIVTDGAVQLAPVYVAVVFGALLGRTTLDTGIARAMVNLAAEYGGEQPLLLALILCAIVALLFTSLSGLGGIIMVGSIVLPIMMTTGMPRTIAATLFLMAFALGFIFNIANWTFYTKYFGVPPPQLIRYAIVLAIVDAAALIAYAVISFARERGYATWAVRGASPEDGSKAGRVPSIALLTPLLPLVLYYTVHMDAAPAFVLSAVFGALVTRPRRAVQTLVAAAIRGIEDVAPALLLFMGIGMLLVATKEPQFASALQPLVAGDWIRNPIAYVAIFGVASPLVLYRGPLNPFGVGIAVFTILLTAHAIAPVLIVAAIMAVVQVQNVCDPTNTANVWIANFTGVPIDTITKRTLPYQTAVAVAATLAAVVATQALFGLRAFASPIPLARAAEPAPKGLYAPLDARDRVAIESDATPFGEQAKDVVAGALGALGVRAFVIHQDPNATDCSQKSYAAYVYVDASTFGLAEGTDLDVGLRLEDCGGWIVNEWHDHETYARPTAQDARALALQGVDRLIDWAHAHQPASDELFHRGIYLPPNGTPTYLYALFKTVDGNMRAYVRAGGPAYQVGLRTGDVVNRVDGRPWWMYGTYQTEQFAYDGKPHLFEVSRGGRTFDIRLGRPLIE
jgi:hypothetical protein